MDESERKGLYLLAIEQYGAGSQMLMAIEELAEAQVAIVHYMRGRNSAMDVAGEIADAQIMLEQMELQFHGVASIRETKLARLKKRLEATND